MKIEALIIHLGRAKERRAQVERLRQALPVASHVIDAVDGSTMSDAEIAKVYKRHIHDPRYPFDLRKAEIGCFLSHRKAWHEIVERELDAGLVIEDDVEVDVARLQIFLALASEHFRASDYLRFPHKLREKGPVLAARNGVSLIEPRVIGLGMVLQLVGREGARALLRETQRFDRPVDTTLQLGIPAVRMLSSSPICVREVSAGLGGSTIQAKAKPLGETLSREVKRLTYRLKLRMR